MSDRKRINLALQGGGSHGAFTWGVLDALVEDGRLEIEALSGTSAGAMNAVIFMQGWAKNRPDGARAELKAFWTELGAMAFTSPIQRTPWMRNPLGLDPLRDLLRRHFDQNAVRECHGIKTFIAATNVQTGRARIFTREELTVETVLASACLPNVHDAVVIDGVPYWDGGFRGNPPIWPFIYASDSRDVVIVELDPSFRPGVPKSNAEIADRLNEITFGGALIAEMRAIAFVQEVIEKGAIAGEFGTRLKTIMIHSINDEASIAPMGSVSKFLIEPAYLEHLFQLGRVAATKWLASTYGDVGVKSSIDLRARFLA